MKKGNRTHKSIKNSMYAMLGQVVTIALNFISRTIFIHTLGVIYLGVNGLFTNLLSVLSFAELGFSTAIIYEMYAPLASNDERKVAGLMNLYAKIYRYVGCGIFVVGVTLIPFLDFFIKDSTMIPSDIPPLGVIYLLFLLNTSISYFYNYKRSIVIASQNGYIDSINQMVFNIIRNVLQICVLLAFNSFIAFLVIQLVCTFLSNVFISIKANKLYPYLNKWSNEKVCGEILRSIKKNVLAMAFNKLGGVAVGGVNNLMIAKFVGIVAVGCYSNYLLIINTIRTVFIQLFIPITASVGNFVVTKTKEESYEFFKKLLFVNAYIAIFISVCMATLINSFISIFWGKEYVFSIGLTLMIVFNFYIDRVRQSSQMFIDVNGLFWQIKWRAACEAVLTIVLVSLFLIEFDMGINGVVLGTLLVNIFINLWWEAYVVYKNIFRKNVGTFLLLQMKYILVLVVCFLATFYTSSYFQDNILGFVSKMFISLLFPNMLMIFAFHRSQEWKYFFNLLSENISKRMK